MVPGWDISTWDGEIDTGAESVVHSGQTALGVTLDAWGGIALFNPLEISQYGYLEFYINGGPQGGQGLEIYIWDAENDTGVEHSHLCRFTSSSLLPPDEWLLVRFPMQHVDLFNRQVSININSATDQPVPQFYLDDIRLVREGYALIEAKNKGEHLRHGRFASNFCISLLFTFFPVHHMWLFIFGKSGKNNQGIGHSFARIAPTMVQLCCK